MCPYDIEIEAIKNQLIKKYNPLDIILFGSCAKGRVTRSSDVDICIILETDDKRKRSTAKGRRFCMPVPQANKKNTYADYLTWPENERWELIDGVPYLQAAPTWQHQALSVALLAQFYNYLSGKACQVFASPFDLRLPEANEKDEETTFVVQPDIVVVCDKEGLKGTGYYGTPTLVIEISSPSTTRNDKIWKFNRYEKAGVKEYWIVEPDAKFVSVFTLQPNHRYGRPESYTETDKIEVSVFSDLVIDLQPVFESV